MSISSLYLEAFFACAQAGHFTKAAEKLHITQSALSQRIMNLEDDLETSLFVRDRSGLKLTAAGEELLRYCLVKNSLEEQSLNKIKNKNTKLLTGHVRIGGFSSVMRSVIMPSLAPLLKENPDLQLLFISKEMDELPTYFRRGEIDHMILFNEFVHDGIETHHIGDEQDVLVEQKNYNGPDIFLDHDENDHTTSRYLRMREIKQPKRRRYLDEVYTLMDGVKSGLGRSILPLHIVKHEKSIVVVDKKMVLKTPVFLHYYRQPFYTELHKQIVKNIIQNAPKYF
jgi:DNA-binding transcriptional LysR family regulator